MTPARRRAVLSKAERFHRTQQKLTQSVSMDEMLEIIIEQPTKQVLDYAANLRKLADEIERRVRTRKRTRTH